MIDKAVFRWSILICLLATASQVHARDFGFQRNISAFLQYADSQFVELDDEDNPYNEEKGTLLYSGFGGSWQFNSGIFIEAYYRTAGDDLDYRGYSQFGQFVESQTEYFIRDTQITMGRNFGLTSAYLGLGNRFRERNVLATGSVAGLYEETDITYALFGLKLNLLAGKPFQIRFSASLATDIKSDLYASSEIFDAFTIETGKHFMAAGNVEFIFHLFSGLTLSLIPEYEYFHINQSDSYRVYVDGEYKYDGAHPESEYEALSLKTKLSWNF
jgi:hypothetical protein